MRHPWSVEVNRQLITIINIIAADHRLYTYRQPRQVYERDYPGSPDVCNFTAYIYRQRVIKYHKALIYIWMIGLSLKDTKTSEGLRLWRLLMLVILRFGIGWNRRRRLWFVCLYMETSRDMLIKCWWSFMQNESGAMEIGWIKPEKVECFPSLILHVPTK